jgi:surface protein
MVVQKFSYNMVIDLCFADLRRSAEDGEQEATVSIPVELRQIIKLYLYEQIHNGNIHEVVKEWIYDTDDEPICLWTYGHISFWDTSRVTDMNRLFFDPACSLTLMPYSRFERFNDPLNAWDVSNVTDMKLMFAGASEFNQPLNDWDVSNVQSMMGMFRIVKQFNQPLDRWDVSQVTDTSYMFAETKVFNQPLNAWQVASVRTMRAMFWRSESFNQPLDQWKIHAEAVLDHMLLDATAFEHCQEWSVPLGGVTKCPY